MKLQFDYSHVQHVVYTNNCTVPCLWTLPFELVACWYVWPLPCNLCTYLHQWPLWSSHFGDTSIQFYIFQYMLFLWLNFLLMWCVVGLCLCVVWRHFCFLYREKTQKERMQLVWVTVCCNEACWDHIVTSS